MTDIVIPLGTGSRHNNLEIRYCLRGIEQYLSDYAQIYIIGECPKWMKNVIHLPYKEDNRNPPDQNICLKILRACNLPCSDPFLFMNDDHYFLSDYSAATFPNYYCQTLTDMLQIRNSDPYGQRMLNTRNYLKSKGLKDFNFDIHFPILYKKQEFVDRVGSLNWNIRHGYVVKSLYGNYETEIEETWDCKVNNPTDDLKMFSSKPIMKPEIINFLKSKLPNPSKYE